MIFYNQLEQRKIEGFDIIIDYTYSWEHPYAVFPKKKYNVDAILDKIDKGKVEYFNLRIRALLKDKEFAKQIVPNLLYSDAYDILKQEELEYMVSEVLSEAKEEAEKLKKLLEDLI